MTLWWLQPGWTDATCSCCGAKIYPEGDPDWGKCFSCFSAELDERAEQQRFEQEEADYFAMIEAQSAFINGETS